MNEKWKCKIDGKIMFKVREFLNVIALMSFFSIVCAKTIKDEGLIFDHIVQKRSTRL